MDFRQLSTGIIVIDSSLEKIGTINNAAEKILGWDLTTLNQNFNKLKNFNEGLSAFAKLIKELPIYLEESLANNKTKRIEIKINNQYYNLYLQFIDKKFILELNPIIYQDMKQSTHELKRPIQNIKTLVETLEMGAKNDTSKRDEYLSKLNQEADRLGTMVQDMLSLSHVLSGTVELNLIEIDLHSKIEKIIATAQSRASTRNISLINEIPKNIKIIADAKLFEHLLANLIDNAIKYNKDNGKVWIKYTNGIITIEDSGRGIPAEDLNKIFDQFYRVKHSLDVQGSGLGLAIVKAIIDLHGWQIDLESELGKGTCFKIKSNS